MKQWTSILVFAVVLGAGCSSSRPPEAKEHLLRIYFVNNSREAMDMKMETGPVSPFLLYAVERKVFTSTPEQAALEQLLAGPQEKEASEGYDTMLNGLRLTGFRIGGDTAYVDLEGSPRFSGLLAAPRMRGQVERTMKEFPAIKVVEVWINSKIDFDSLK